MRRRQLARGELDAFAAWSVSERDATQLLLTDMRGQTRSWLRAVALHDAVAGTTQTRLYFGSAVLPLRGRPDAPARLGVGYRALLRFHRAYSVALLAAASARLQRNAG